ncbi:hypothetical protein Hanom_Chr10g00920241 [Helianthus anomalus]
MILLNLHVNIDHIDNPPTLMSYVMEHQYPQHEDLVQVMWLSLKTVPAPSFFRRV